MGFWQMPIAQCGTYMQVSLIGDVVCVIKYIVCVMCNKPVVC